MTYTHQTVIYCIWHYIVYKIELVINVMGAKKLHTSEVKRERAPNELYAMTSSWAVCANEVSFSNKQTHRQTDRQTDCCCTPFLTGSSNTSIFTWATCADAVCLRSIRHMFVSWEAWYVFQYLLSNGRYFIHLVLINIRHVNHMLHMHLRFVGFYTSEYGCLNTRFIDQKTKIAFEIKFPKKRNKNKRHA